MMRADVQSSLIGFLFLYLLIQHGVGSHLKESTDADTIVSEEELAQILHTVLEKSLENETDKPYDDEDDAEDDNEEKNKEDSYQEKKSSFKNQLYEMLRNLDAGEEIKPTPTSDTLQEAKTIDETIDDKKKEDEDVNDSYQEKKSSFKNQLYEMLRNLDVGEEIKPTPTSDTLLEAQTIDETIDDKKKEDEDVNDSYQEKKSSFKNQLYEMLRNLDVGEEIKPTPTSDTLQEAQTIDETIDDKKKEDEDVNDSDQEKKSSFKNKLYEMLKNLDVGEEIKPTPTSDTLHGAQTIDETMADNEKTDEDINVRVPDEEQGSGWKMDLEDINPDTVAGRLALSFMDVQNGSTHNAEGVDPKKSKKYIGDSMDNLKLTEDQKTELGLTNKNDGGKRNFLVSAKLWPKGIVPYIISRDFSSDQRNTILGAIEEMKHKTCVKFEPMNSRHAQQLGHFSYIEFISDQDGCWSYVGRAKIFQRIGLEKPGCVSNEVAIHEMTHAIGMVHEQSRSDRDRYEEILWENVMGGKSNKNMAKLNTRDVNPFDAESVLQYNVYAFSKNSEKTIKFKDPRLQFLASEADGLEFYDVADITKIYKCAEHCTDAPVCQNGGFVDFQCKCFCPSGTKGTLCEQADTDSGCGGVVDVSRRPQEIQTPNYPNKYPLDSRCVWLVKAAPGNLVKMDIKDLHLSANYRYRCYHWLEVRFNLPGQTGPRECGSTRHGSYQTTPDGEGNLMILIFDSRYAKDKAPSKGFRLTVSRVITGKNACSKQPCVNGKCRSADLSSYTCTCSTGFTGKNCDQVEPRSNKPCVNGNCSSTDSNSYTCTCTTGFIGTNCDQGDPNYCSFEDDKCFMSNAKNDDFDWTSISGPTPSRYTGPLEAHSGTKYMYAEMSRPRNPGDIAVLESRVALQTSTERCLTMWYYMYGRNVRTLQVLYEGTGVSKRVVWRRMLNKGKTWQVAHIDIAAVANLKIFIEAERGARWDSDIAIDDLKLEPGSCPIILTCSFEDNTCFMTNATGDDFDWTPNSGSTPTYFTGPSSAHSGKKYMYAEMSYPRKPDDVAVLESSVAFPTSTERCLTMWYCMYGPYVKTLRVSFQGTGVSKTELWSQTGNKGKGWLKANIDIPAVTNLKIFIEAVRGHVYWSDIAIDDLILKEGSGCTKT